MKRQNIEDMKNHIALAIGGATLGLLALSYTAYAAIPLPSTITVCIKNEGLVYVVGKGFKSKECERKDKLFTFSTTGAVGPQGPQGPVGPQGPAGIAGANGLPGAQGPQGPLGPTGLQGEQGLQGVQGIPGVAGPDGNKGVTGDKGPVGDKGATGDVGPQGPVGPAGTGTGTGIEKSRTYTKYATEYIARETPERFIALTATAYCDDANDVLLSGGYWIDATVSAIRNYRVEGLTGISGWAVSGYGALGGIYAEAYCLRID